MHGRSGRRTHNRPAMTEQHHPERRTAPRKNPVKSAAERLVEAERKALVGMLKAQRRERRV